MVATVIVIWYLRRMTWRWQISWGLFVDRTCSSTQETRLPETTHWVVKDAYMLVSWICLAQMQGIVSNFNYLICPIVSEVVTALKTFIFWDNSYAPPHFPSISPTTHISNVSYISLQMLAVTGGRSPSAWSYIRKRKDLNSYLSSSVVGSSPASIKKPIVKNSTPPSEMSSTLKQQMLSKCFLKYSLSPLIWTYWLGSNYPDHQKTNLFHHVYGRPSDI